MISRRAVRLWISRYKNFSKRDVIQLSVILVVTFRAYHKGSHLFQLLFKKDSIEFWVSVDAAIFPIPNSVVLRTVLLNRWMNYIMKRSRHRTTHREEHQKPECEGACCRRCFEYYYAIKLLLVASKLTLARTYVRVNVETLDVYHWISQQRNSVHFIQARAHNHCGPNSCAALRTWIRKTANSQQSEPGAQMFHRM